MNEIDRLTEVPGYTARMVMVTPADAATLLKRNTHNRKVRPSVVAKYVSEIGAGEWRPIPAGIGFDEDGVLLDGQHRLAAIVEAGVAVPLLVVTGFPRASQEKCDRHTRRSLFDAMTLAGYSYSKDAVQACTVLAKMRAENAQAPTQSVGMPADHLVKEALSVYGQSAKAMNVCHGGKSTPANRLFGRAGCLAAFTLWHKYEPTKALAFRTMVVDATAPHRDHPASAAIRSVQSPGWYGSMTSQRELQSVDFSKAMTAILAFRDGRDVQVIKAYAGKLPWAV